MSLSLFVRDVRKTRSAGLGALPTGAAASIFRRSGTDARPFSFAFPDLSIMLLDKIQFYHLTVRAMDSLIKFLEKVDS